ncbi:hypothetical protein, partial [Rhizobium mayense]
MASHRNPPLPPQIQQPKTAGANSKLDKTWGQGHKQEIVMMMSGVAADRIARAALRQRRDTRQSELAQIQRERLICEDSLFNTNLLIHVSHEIERNVSSNRPDDQGALVANDAETYKSWAAVTPYEVASYLTAGSRVFPILRNERVESFRNRTQDRMAFQNGDVPLSFRGDLTEEQCRRGHDRLAEFLARRVARKDIKSLVDGKLTYEDFGIKEDLRKTIEEIVGQGVTDQSRDIPDFSKTGTFQ